LVWYNKRKVEEDGKPLCQVERMLEVILKFQDRSMLEYGLAHGLNAVVSQHGCSYGYKVGNKEARE